jgi:predicted O-linked N-acetylglucosamine transferase (SPINDLY family)
MQHYNAGHLPQAEDIYQQILQVDPEHPVALHMLGVIAHHMGKNDIVVDLISRAVAIAPDYVDAHNHLGNALRYFGKLDEAVASYHKALALEPNYADAHSNLGITFKDLGKLDEAVASYHKALAFEPNHAYAHNNLGNVLKDLGRLDEAVASYHKALGIKPDYVQARSNLLLTEQYRLGHNTQTLYELHREWDERHGREFRAAWPEHRNIPEPDRRLRIGFVSPDLRRHPVGYFIVGLLENLSENEIETVCYSDHIDDDLTGRIKAATDVWRNVRGTSDENLIKTILDDEIDILFDLTGHSANNRLLVFARKPAPLQVTWAGYVGTTGLSAIDYLVSDIYSTREDEEEYYSENIIRMPDGWLCYAPPDYAPEIGPLPRKRNSGITFGSFSNSAKINQEVVSVWAKILHGVADSCLLLKSRSINSIANTELLMAMFEAEGINQSRLMLEGHSPHAELLARYNDVDIALDPFPYSGGLTTYEALWMGVPVITVPGETFASRHSLSHLSTIGLPELVARNRDDYVKLAVGLANDGSRLASLRAELREKMAGSPICDGEKFAADFATIMRDIWCNWCLSKG